MNDEVEDNKHPIDRDRSLMGFVFLSFKGFCMGVADVIPGISGGTIAFMLGIYEHLITAIKSFDFKLVKLLMGFKIKKAFGAVPWRFLAALGFGIVSAILLLSEWITWLLVHHPVLIKAFFFGLILLTVPILAIAVKKWSFVNVLAFFGAAVGAFFLVMMVPVQTPETWWFVFLSGALAICAMILPGISGSFILLLLGKYEYILNAVHQRDILTILIMMCGMAVGILSFVRVLEYFFKKAHDFTMAILTGFVAGSLNKIWPWKRVFETMITDKGKVVTLHEVNVMPHVFDDYFFYTLLLFLGGCVVAFVLHRIPSEKGEVIE